MNSSALIATLRFLGRFFGLQIPKESRVEYATDCLACVPVRRTPNLSLYQQSNVADYVFILVGCSFYLLGVPKRRGTRATIEVQSTFSLKRFLKRAGHLNPKSSELVFVVVVQSVSFFRRFPPLFIGQTY